MNTPGSQEKENQLSSFGVGLKAWLSLTWGYPDRAFCF